MILNPNLSLEEYAGLFKYADVERAAVERYLGVNYKYINSLFVNNGGEYEKRNKMDHEFRAGDPSARDAYVYQMQQTIDMVPLVYSAMIKSGVRNQDDNVMKILHRGTSLHEIRSLNVGASIDRLISTTSHSEGANWQAFLHNENQDAPVHMMIRLDPHSGVPTIEASDIFPDASNWEKETIVAPFAQIKDIHNNGKRRTERGSVYDEYTVTLEEPKLEALSEEERKELGASVEARAPRMYDLLTEIISADERIDDIKAMFGVYSNRRREYTKERKSIYSELYVLDYFASETELKDLISLWSYMLESKETGQPPVGITDDKMENVIRVSQKYGIPLEEYSPDIERYIINGIETKLRDIDMFCHDMDPLAQQVNSTFTNTQRRMGISREEMFYELQRKMTGLGYKDIEPMEMLSILSDASSFFEEHLRICGMNDFEALEYRIETARRKKDSIDDELNFLAESERKGREEIQAITENVEKIKPEVSAWKEDIIRICKSDCREIEIMFEENMRIIEEEKARKAKEVEFSSMSVNSVSQEPIIQKEVASEEPGSISSTEDNKRVLQEKMDIAFDMSQEFLSRIVPSQMGFTPKEYGSLEVLARRNTRIANEIQSLAATSYTSKVMDYKNVLETTQDSLMILTNLSMNPEYVDGVIDTMQALDSGELLIYDGEVSSEILKIQETDENLFKKLVFERFCKFAIDAEMASLRDEAASIRASIPQNSFTRLFGGPSKQDIARCEQIEAYVASASQSKPKEYRNHRYSYRDIVAEMEVFTEQHVGDPRYAEAISRIQQLEGTLNTYYKASPESIEQKKANIRAEQSKSGIDPRAYRINSLKNKMEKNGILTRNVPTQAYLTLKRTNRLISSRIAEMTHDQTQDLEHSASEISQ